MRKVIHGDGQRFAPEPGQETPMAEQYARLQYVATQLDFDGKQVLDCGCGTGYSLAFLAAATPSAHYVGIDVDDGAVAYARTRYPDLDFRVMDGATLNFDSSSFDIVLSFEVLEHLNALQQSRYISEMHRTLKPGGTLVLSTPNKNIFSMGHDVSLNAFHVRELTLEQLLHLLTNQYRSIDVYGQYFHDDDLRGREFAHLQALFQPSKRLKRRMVRVLRRFVAGKWLHELYEQRGQLAVGRADPMTISAQDFAFDRQHLEMSKWFLCLCHK